MYSSFQKRIFVSTKYNCINHVKLQQEQYKVIWSDKMNEQTVV